ncbi:MAG: radical SAM protein [Archaeoglobales archaeon]|nr:radical SAM protein [Archaeoglobales archaeon]
MPRIEAGSYYTYLPEGCRLCRRGAKLVLFITGECRNSCFYCPISLEKKNKDVVYANERPLKSYKDFISEIEAMDAEGVAITGGEPILKLERVLDFLKIAKEFSLHVHLYTSQALDEEKLEALKYIDEIRFHPPMLKNAEKYAGSIKTAKELGMDAGFEIPAISFEPKIVEIVNENDAFLNLNQLEVSETNYNAIRSMGFEILDYYVIPDEKILRGYERAKKFHYCSAKFKDVAQFRRRLIRMAMNLPDFYMVTRDGTVICCRIEGNLDKAEKLLKEAGFEYRRFDKFIETSAEIVEKIGERLKAEKLNLKLVERYPTYNGIVIESEDL